MAVAGGPTGYSDYAGLASASSAKPLVHLVAQAGQSLSDGISTAITFGSGSEEIDTHGFHDTASNTSRITPTVAGYYRFYGAVFFPGFTDYVNMQCWVRKNGSTSLYPAGRRENLALNQTVSLSCLTVAFMNGSGDYVELMALQDNSASAARTTTAVDSASAPAAKSVFGCELLRLT